MTEKPPLGLMPKNIWLEQRVDELLRAINDHRQFMLTNPGIYWGTASRWSEELRDVTKQLHDMDLQDIPF